MYAVYSLQKEGSLGETDENGFYTVGTASSGVALNVEVHENERFVGGTTNAIVLWKVQLFVCMFQITTKGSMYVRALVLQIWTKENCCSLCVSVNLPLDFSNFV